MTIGCTKKLCAPEMMGEAKCLDDECPSDCSSWYDGCNTCTCNEGKIGACTERWCFQQEEPRCLDEPASDCPSDCTTWFDGCNTCTCADGMTIGCTKKLCAPEMMGEAKCLDDECPSDCSSWY